uniref:Uncharacterized protein n=1 Tax=Knipowitschia caucasica TaxID=637954 RepID=A0AAV2IZ75_KNICA
MEETSIFSDCMSRILKSKEHTREVRDKVLENFKAFQYNDARSGIQRVHARVRLRGPPTVHHRDPRDVSVCQEFCPIPLVCAIASRDITLTHAHEASKPALSLSLNMFGIVHPNFGD